MHHDIIYMVVNVQKINNFLNKNINLIICIFLILQPIIDLLTGISINFNISFSFGVIVRALFIIFILYYLFFISKCLYRKKSLILITLILIYMFIFVINHKAFFEFSNMVKCFYFPIVFIGLFNIYNEKKIEFLSNNYLLYVLSIYIGVIFIADITNTAFNSYDIAKTNHVGNVGWFYSANEIGAIIALIIPILFETIYKKINIAKILLLILTVIASFKIGTRTPIISLFICLVFYYIKYIILFIKNKRKKTLTITIFASLVALSSFVIIFPKTPVYQNIITHTKYLKIDSVSDIFKNSETLDNFIFSKRFGLLNETNNIYKSEPLKNKLMGIDYSNNSRTTEMDMFDIFYRCGVVGFIVYFGTIISIFIINRKKINKIYLLPTFLMLFISFFAGHVFTAPSVSIIATFILIKLLLEPVNNKKELLFCSYNLGLGGIEKALVNLLKNIDYNKYNVTLVLERKEGMFLNKIDKNIKIIEYKVSDNKNVIFRKIVNLCKEIKWILLNYKSYSFSCCYATYSLPCNLISRLSSNNNALYIHSNYTHIYKSDIEVKDFFNKRKIEKFRKIIFVSNEAKNDLIKIFPSIDKKSLVINNFIDYKEIEILSKEKINEKKPKNNSLFVFVGRLENESKNLVRLVEVFQNIYTLNKDFELWIIGDGKDKNLLNELIDKYKLHNNIKLLGTKTNPYPYIKMSDYIILTSNYEGFPVIYNEAIILERPIITTIDVSDDFISIPNRFGYIISKDSKEAANEILEILKNSNLKLEKINFEIINNKKKEKLEKIFGGVI